MSAVPVVTRFAPSPSGEMHLGNARVALFNALPNLVMPDDVLPWVEVVFGPDPALDADATAAVTAADRSLFAAAAEAAGDNDFSVISAAARTATGLRGPALFKPLRAALTGRLAGPELGPLLRAMPAGAARQRLARFA